MIKSKYHPSMILTSITWTPNISFSFRNKSITPLYISQWILSPLLSLLSHTPFSSLSVLYYYYYRSNYIYLYYGICCNNKNYLHVLSLIHSSLSLSLSCTKLSPLSFSHLFYFYYFSCTYTIEKKCISFLSPYHLPLFIILYVHFY